MFLLIIGQGYKTERKDRETGNIVLYQKDVLEISGMNNMIEALIEE